MTKHLLLPFALLALILPPGAGAGEGDHAELDAFMEEAAALLPVGKRIAHATTANLQVETPADRATYGEWGPLLDWPHIPVTAANLPDGRIVTFASNSRTNFPRGVEFTYAGVWDPQTGEHTEINHETHDMFCAGTAMGIDGRPMFAGGRNVSRSTSVFDYENDRWLRVEDMNDGRWYPSGTTLPDGSILVAAGSRAPGRYTAERYTKGGGWTRLLGIPWRAVPSRDFPHNFVAPDGRVLQAGPLGKMQWIDPSGNGELTPTSVELPSLRLTQSGGIAMYDVGKLIFAGGGGSGGATNVVHTIDMNSQEPAVAEVAPMQHSRRFHNALMLPDGKAIMVGGNSSGIAFSDSGTIYAPEMWDPATDSWSELANMSRPRNYHSVALMLPDARVYSGGGGLSANTDTNHQNAQIFSPPYLFNPDGSEAQRPAITAAPPEASPGNLIRVEGSADITRFTMIRLTATTHAFTSDVRFLEIPHSEAVAGSFDLELHPNVNVIIPGYWMIFGLNTQGTPSHAHTIKITAPTPPVIAPVPDQHTLVGHEASLSISAGDGAGDPLIFTATGLPPGLQIDSSDGTITGNPSSVGSYPIQVTADDGSLSTTTSFTWQVSEDPGLVAHWRFDEGEGTVAHDLGGAGADGSVINGATWIPGIHGNAISFDGIEQHVLIPNQPELEIGQDNADFSVSCWVQLDQGDTDIFRTIVHKGGADQRTFALLLHPPTRVYANVSTDNDNAEGVVSLSNLQLGEWNHLAMVKEGDLLKLYINGVAENAHVLTGSIDSNSDPIHAGFSQWHPGTACTLDDLAIYNRALSSTEVAFMANPEHHIVGANSAPSITSPGDQVDALQPTSLRVEAEDPNGDPITFSDDGQLPPGLTLNPSTGMISGTPSTPGTFTPTITASDGIGESSISFQWQIVAPITADAAFPGPVQSGSDAQFSITATGPDLAYAWDFGDGSEIVATTSETVSHSYSQPGRYLVTSTIVDAAGQSHQVSFRQAVHPPMTDQAPAVSQSIVYEPRDTGNDRVWNVNPDNHSVSAFDTITHDKLAEIAVGNSPRAIAVAPGGEIWVTNKRSASISRISPDTLAVIATIDLPRASQPYGIAFSPTGTSAFVTLEARGELVVLDATTGDLSHTIAVGDTPRHLAVNHDGSTVYVSRYITPPVTGEATSSPQPADGEGGEIVVVSTSDLAVTDTIILRPSTLPDDLTSARGIPNYLGAPAISPDGASAWIASKQDNIQRGDGRDGMPLNHDNTIRSITSRIDLENALEDHGARVDHDDAGIASTSLFGKFGNFVFSALEGSRHVAVSDAYNHHEILRFKVQRAPQGLAISPDGRTLYVHNYMSRSVTVHDLSAIIEGSQEQVSQVATYRTVADERLHADVLLGKQHFYDSGDSRLALEEYISCAACHNDGAHDGRVWDLTGFGEGLRNTIDLRGRAGTGHGPLHWSANFDEVQDFEGQIRALSGGGGLNRNGNPHPPLGAPNAGTSGDLDALAAFVTSLASFDDSPLREADGTLSAAAQSGKALFTTANCASCHSGSAFTDSTAGLRHDIGTLKPSSGQRLGSLLDGLDTPTLRGVASGAPYLHDGSAPTLEDAIAAHSNADFLTPAEIAEIASFLREIDGTEPAPLAPNPDQFLRSAETIALYHFDEDFDDSGAHGLHLSPEGYVTLAADNLSWMDYPEGQVARFSADGDSLSVSIPDALIQPSSGAPLTIAARIYPRAYPEASAGDRPILSLYQEWDSSFELRRGQTGNQILSGGAIVANAQQWASATAIDRWQLLQISYDGIGTVSAWIDGVPLGAVQISPNPHHSTEWTLTLGNFDGDIDELHICRLPSPAGAPAAASQSPLAAATDAYNLVHGTDITLPSGSDLDGDGSSDLLEVAHGSDAGGFGAPLSRLNLVTNGAVVHTTYSITVPEIGAPTADGYRSAAFDFKVEASTDYDSWTEPVTLVANPDDLPPPPPGFRFITFRQQAASDERTFFRTIVTGNG